MATMAAIGCSCAGAAAATASATVKPLTSVRVQAAGMRLLGRTGHLKRGLGSSSLGLLSAANVGQEKGRFSRLGVHARAKLNGLEMGPAEEVKEGEMQEDSSGFYEKAFLAAAVALIPLVDSEAASAVGGELGILEGRSVALIHPIVMAGLLVYTLYAGFLGWQWRRVRTIQTDIAELKKQVKQVPVAAGEKSGPPPPPSPVDAQINSLTEERKELVKGGYKDRHFNAGSILLGLGVFESISGAVNTWFRTGKLFPGPHLFAGAGITICWALAASLVPAMQKGNETARNLHIGLNLINVGLFIWQIPTGLEIVYKVFELAPLP